MSKCLFLMLCMGVVLVFLAFIRRGMMQRIGRSTVHLPIVARNPRAVERASTVRSSAVFTAIREQAVGVELLTGACVFVLCSLDHVHCRFGRGLLVRE